MTLEDIARRRASKRFNERLKLLATFFNNTGIATLVGGYVLPFLGGAGPTSRQTLSIWGYAFAAHILAQVALTLLRSED